MKIKSPESSFPCSFLSLAAALLPRVVGMPLLLFGIASVLRAKVVLDVRCYGGAVLRASEGRRKPLGAASTYTQPSVLRAEDA